MNLNDVITLMQTMNQNCVTSLDWEHDGNKLHLECGNVAAQIAAGPNGPCRGKPQTLEEQAAFLAAAAGSGSSAADAVVTPFTASASGDATNWAGTAETPAAALPGELIKSPVVGVYFAAPSPDSDPFVQVGSKIEAGTTVCIIEAMKLMNEVTSSIEGEVTEILVENGQRVEFGQPLFRIV